MECSIKINGQYESLIFHSKIIQTNGKDNIILQARINDNTFSDYQKIVKCNTITKIDLPYFTDLKLISNKPFEYSYPGLIPTYMNKHKIEDYLYEIQYGNIDYSYAYSHIDKTLQELGGCSSIRNGNLFGRNFDWKYNNQVQFVVHTPSTLNHYAVLGVSGLLNGVEQSNVENDDIIIDGIDMFKLVPFCLLDGINEKGVFCTQNVVPLDDIPTREIPAKIEEKERVCVSMLVRFILDRFSSASLALEYIKNYVTIYFPDKMIDDWKYQSHFMLGDKNSTYIIEFLNEELIVTTFPYITNFPIYNVEFGFNNLIQYPPTQYGMNKFGSGLERWDIISKNYNKTNSLEGMTEILDLVKYSNCYSHTDFWYSEIVGMLDDSLTNKITVDTDPNFCSTSHDEVMNNWETKSRDTGKVWITCHSSIYDISTKNLIISNQENDIKYKFELI